jgi:iron(III) transport system substrate-binding protein
VDPLIQQFGEATGIDVKVKYASTPQLAATLQEEGNNSPADLFFAQDPGGLGSVEEMLSPLPQNILDQVPQWARSGQGKWVGISGRARVVVYNTNNLTPEDLPDNLWDFTDPRWKGRIGWPTTNASFQTMVTGMRSIWGEDKTRQWLQGIKDNDAKFYAKNTPTVDAVGSGEIDVGFVNHYYLYRFLSVEGESFSARNYHTTSGGPGALIMVAGAGILSTAKNRPEAEKFLEFMLSEVAQGYFASSTFEYPLVDGVTVNQLLTPLEEINQPQISIKNLSDLEGTQDLLREVGVLP